MARGTHREWPGAGNLPQTIRDVIAKLDVRTWIQKGAQALWDKASAAIKSYTFGPRPLTSKVTFGDPWNLWVAVPKGGTGQIYVQHNSDPAQTLKDWASSQAGQDALGAGAATVVRAAERIQSTCVGPLADAFKARDQARQKAGSGAATTDPVKNQQGITGLKLDELSKEIKQLLVAQKTATNGGARACFAAGTPLLVPGGSKLIEMIQVGDLVLSRDEFDWFGAVETKVVEEVFERFGRIVHLHVAGQVIVTTPEHPFWVVDRGAWVPAFEILPNERLIGHAGQPVVVEEVYDTGEYATVYNLRIADHHTYFVGTDEWGWDVWAHNTYEEFDSALTTYETSENISPTKAKAFRQRWLSKIQENKFAIPNLQRALKDTLGLSQKSAAVLATIASWPPLDGGGTATPARVDKLIDLVKGLRAGTIENVETEAKDKVFLAAASWHVQVGGKTYNLTFVSGNLPLPTRTTGFTNVQGPRGLAQKLEAGFGVPSLEQLTSGSTVYVGPTLLKAIADANKNKPPLPSETRDVSNPQYQDTLYGPESALHAETNISQVIAFLAQSWGANIQQGSLVYLLDTGYASGAKGPKPPCTPTCAGALEILQHQLGKQVPIRILSDIGLGATAAALSQYRCMKAQVAAH